MTPTSNRSEATSRTRAHAGLAILALAMGGFAIGTTEFVTMGLLPEIAQGVDVSIPTGGHVISAYALGVVVGAPVLAMLGAKLPRRALLLGLMVAFVVGNVASALATSYDGLLVARFVSGLPHGAYFGVASLVAAGLVPAARRGRAVSRVMLGLAVANVAGVPAATWLGQHLGWRSAYWAVGVLGLVTVALVLWFVPTVAADRNATGRRELKAFGNLQVWLTLLVGAVGFGGMFAMYSYIAPTVTDVAGQSASMVPVYLLVYGLGMTFGTVVAGRMADWSVFRSMLIGVVAMGLDLVLFTQTAQWLVPGLLTVFALSVFASVMVVGLQMRLMQVAGDAQTLGAALNHASLNMANALGAWLGGLVIAGGYGYVATSWVGAGLSGLGLLILLASAAVHLRGHGLPKNRPGLV